MQSHSPSPPGDANCEAMQSNELGSVDGDAVASPPTLDERQRHHHPDVQEPLNESSTNERHECDNAPSPMPIDCQSVVHVNSGETPPYATAYNDQIDDNDATDTYYAGMCASLTAEGAISDDGRLDGNDADTSDMDDEDCEKPGDFEDDCEVDTHMGIRTNGPNNGIAYGDSDINVAATYNGHFLDSNRKTDIYRKYHTRMHTYDHPPQFPLYLVFSFNYHPNRLHLHPLPSRSASPHPLIPRLILLPTKTSFRRDCLRAFHPLTDHIRFICSRSHLLRNGSEHQLHTAE